MTILTILLATSAVAPTQTPKNFAFETTIKTVVVFRDGFGFYLREGAAKLEDGWATTNLVPQAVGGTFWVYPLNSTERVDTIVLTNDNRIAFESPEKLRQELADKVGLHFSIVADDRTVTGKLTHVLDTMMLLKDQTGNYVAIEYAKVASVTLVGHPVKIKIATKNPNSEVGIGIAYIQEGIRWEPTYILEVLSSKSGRLTLRGTLLNLPEELENANAVFVVGSPSLSNRGVIDQLLQGFASGLSREEFERKELADKSAAAPAPAAGGRGGFGGGGAQTGGLALPPEESGELQYYMKPNFSLRPGERAMTTILEVQVPLTALFEWNADGDDVAYILTIENTSKQPLTSGSVFVVEDLRPIGQQNIKYTAAGDKAELRLAKGIGLRVQRAEVETARSEPLKIGDRQYFLIQMKGTLTIDNFRNQSADLRISKTVVGKVLTVGAGGSVKNTRIQLDSPNPVHALEWKVAAPPGGKTTVEYTYEAYNAIAR